MKKNITTLNHLDSLAADVSQDTTRKVAEVASTAVAAIRELAEQIVMTGSSIAIIVDSSEPNDNNAYWLHIEDTEGGA